MNFVDLRYFKLEGWWWEHESIDSSIFTKMDLRLFSFKAMNSLFVMENLFLPIYIYL